MSASIGQYASEINQDYLEELGRVADPDALAAWTHALSGGATDAQLRDSLATSVEAQGDLNTLYEGLLGRAIDTVGLSNGMISLANGGSLQAFRQAVASTAEAAGTLAAMVAAATGGGSASAGLIAVLQHCLATTWTLPQVQSWLAGECASIDGLYQSVLGRAADPSGLAALLGEIAGGASLATLQGQLAGTPEAANALAAQFANVTGGGAASPGWVAAMQANLANGWTLGTVGGWLSNESASIDGLYQSVLGRRADPAGLAADLNAAAAGASLTQLAIGLSQSAEAASGIDAAYQSVLRRAADPAGLATAQTIMASGGGLAGVRSALAGSAEAQTDLTALYQQVLGRPATAADLAGAQAALASGASWGQIQAGIASSPEAAAAVGRLYQQVLGRPVDAGSLGPAMAELGTQGYAGLATSLAGSAEAAADIDALYQDVLGRAADPGGLATYQGILAQGGTLATVRQDLAQSAEAAGVVQSFYQISFGRAATADEVTGMQFALGLSISDTDTFALYNTQNQPLAVTGAGNLLTQLPVAVTLDNGVTPLLTVPGGGSQQFANATQLAAALLGLSLRQGQADLGTLSAYQATVDWLVQIDQPMLQVAATLAAQARLATSEGNQAQATLAAAAYQLALRIAALPPAARGGPDWGLSASVQVNGHTTDVIVYNDTSTPGGHVVYHDKAPDVIGGIVEEVGTIVVDVLAVIPATAPIFAPVAAVLNTAEAGQGFAEGNVLGGLLSLASAAGFGGIADGVDIAGTGLKGAVATTGETILAVSQAVGGASAIVQSAENGDALGAAAGALTIAASAASLGIGGTDGNANVIPSQGKITVGGIDVDTAINVTQALAAAAAGASVADALNNGDVSSALITSLGTLFSTIAENVQTSATTQTVNGKAYDQYAAAQNAIGASLNPDDGFTPYQVAAGGDAVPAPSIGAQNAYHQSVVDAIANSLQEQGYTVIRNLPFRDTNTGLLSYPDMTIVSPVANQFTTVLSNLTGLPVPYTVSPLVVVDPDKVNPAARTQPNVGVVEVKTGDATLSKGQAATLDSLTTGKTVIPIGPKALVAGLPNTPLNIVLGGAYIVTFPGLKPAQ